MSDCYLKVVTIDDLRNHPDRRTARRLRLKWLKNQRLNDRKEVINKHRKIMKFKGKLYQTIILSRKQVCIFKGVGYEVLVVVNKGGEIKEIGGIREW